MIILATKENSKYDSAIPNKKFVTLNKPFIKAQNESA
jgi:hypothetical protein